MAKIADMYMGLGNAPKEHGEGSFPVLMLVRLPAPSEVSEEWPEGEWRFCGRYVGREGQSFEDLSEEAIKRGWVEA